MTAIEEALTQALVELKAEKGRITSAISQVRALMASVPKRLGRPPVNRAPKTTRKPRKLAKTHKTVAKPAKVGRPKKASAVAQKLVAYIKAHKGLRMEHISKAIGVPSRKLKDVVKSLVADRQLQVRGRTRGRTYAAA
jgi:hypothetical protein